MFKRINEYLEKPRFTRDEFDSIVFIGIAIVVAIVVLGPIIAILIVRN